MEANVVEGFKHTTFPLKLFQATPVHGLSNNKVIKVYLRLELRGRCVLHRFPYSSSHLYLVFPISEANQSEFEVGEA